jgi:Xaa-Pro aminopeptidase
MNSIFSAEFFRGNRANLRKLFAGTAPIVVTGNGVLQRNSDITFPFRQDSNFWYLTGVEEPEAVLVIDRDKEYLIVAKREGAHEAFDGVTDYGYLAERSGIETVIEPKEGWDRLAKRLKKAKHVATLSAAAPYIEHYTMYTNPARAKMIEKIKDINPELTFLDLREHLTRLRCIKQPLELEAIKQAIAITQDTFKDISRALPRTKSEYEVGAQLYAGFLKRGAKAHAFDPVIAGGVNAATVHYVANEELLHPKEMLLIDAGAEVEHYAAHELTKRQRAVFEAVASVHADAMALLKPGVIPREYEAQVEQIMGEKLRELGLIKVIDHETVRSFYPHLTSHFMGLDAHDVGNYDAPLEPGMVLTVEPGIYLPSEQIGVRIEDDVLITETSVENLTQKLAQLL